MSDDLFGIGDEFVGGQIPFEPNPASPPQPQDGAATGGKFVKKIDLGDGSGVQIFEADSEAALVEKLVEAQKNATAEIRRLQKARPRKRPERPSESKSRVERPFEFVPLTAEEEMRAAQALSENPGRAFAELFERYTGVKPQNLAAIDTNVKTIITKVEENQAAEQFLRQHIKDYHPTPENYEALLVVLEDEELPITLQNLEYAFEQVQDSLTPAPKAPETSTVPARIDAATTGVDANTKKVKAIQTSLSGRAASDDSVAAEPLPKDSELLKGDLSSARARIAAEMARVKSQGVQGQ